MTPPTTALDLYRGDLLARVSPLATLHPGELKRRAAEASRDKAAAALWNLTEAHRTTHGRSGTRVSPKTLLMYREAVRSFVGYATENAVDLLRPGKNVGALYLRFLEAQGYAPATVRVKLAGARALHQALRWADATDADPFVDARAAQDLTPAWDKRQPYAEDEFGRLLGAADPRMRALLLLCGHAGLRIAEALALAWTDVDLSARILVVRHGKGGKTRRVSLSCSLTGALAALPHREGPVIGNSSEAARKRLATLCRRAGVENKGFHALRHYAGTRLVREGHSLDDTARHLGHASIETTRVYAKWSDTRLHDTLNGW